MHSSTCPRDPDRSGEGTEVLFCWYPPAYSPGLSPTEVAVQVSLQYGNDC